MDEFTKTFRRQLRGIPPMTPEEKRTQAISWTVGNVMCQRRYAEMPDELREEEEWKLRRYAANAYDKIRNAPPYA